MFSMLKKLQFRPHLVGTLLQDMIDHALSERPNEAQAIENVLSPLFDVLFITSNPVPVKAALHLMDMPAGDVRLPLVKASADQCQAIRAVLERLNLL